MSDEQALVGRVKAGDSRAFEELVSAYEKKIYNLGLRYTGNPQDAMDICQEVFLRVYRFIGGFGGDSRFSTWIYRIAANVSKDFIAKKSRAAEVSLEVEGEEESFSAEIADMRFSPETELENAELQQAIATAIESLPEKYRQVIVLRDVNGLSYGEIGQVLALEEGTVKSRIARARERLRVFLTQDGNFLPGIRSNPVKGGIDG